MGDRGENLEGFLGLGLLSFGGKALERAHVMESIGELDQDDADVIGHAEEDLTMVFGFEVFISALA